MIWLLLAFTGCAMAGGAVALMGVADPHQYTNRQITSLMAMLCAGCLAIMVGLLGLITGALR